MTTSLLLCSHFSCIKKRENTKGKANKSNNLRQPVEVWRPGGAVIEVLPQGGGRPNACPCVLNPRHFIQVRNSVSSFTSLQTNSFHGSLSRLFNQPPTRRPASFLWLHISSRTDRRGVRASPLVHCGKFSGWLAEKRCRGATSFIFGTSKLCFLAGTSFNTQRLLCSTVSKFVLSREALSQFLGFVAADSQGRD